MAPEKNGDKKAKKTKAKEMVSTSTADEADPFHVFESLEEVTEGGKKHLSIEQIYQKKTQLEHIFLRPSTYIGSMDPHTENVWIYDSETDKMVYKNVTYVPGLYKIFDEIVVNAADNKQRDPSMSTIKINIDQDKNEIMIWNNGRGIPVVEHKTEKMYVPEMIFGTLLTSSNYDDTENRLTGGLNGFGAKLCNIFSKKFTVQTSSKEYGKSFKQTWRDNMGSTDKPVISAAKGEDFTCVTFSPDLARFGMEKLDDDIVALMSRRAYDLTGSTRGVTVYLNGKRLGVKGFKQYVELYNKGRVNDDGAPIKVVFDQPHERWEIAVTVSENGSFQQISFVNSIATMKGGRHVDYVAEMMVDKLLEHVRKQVKKTGVNIRPAQVKNHVWLFVNCLIVNPTFDSQTKENMTLPVKGFGSKCDISDKFAQQAAKCGIVDSILNWLKGKAQSQLDKQCHTTKHSKLKGIAKLDDANDAGSKRSNECTLILTEGDSAKALAVAGLGVVGRDRYGVFPLKGKVLNVREASHKQIIENVEINNLIKILGLQYKKKYESEDDLRTLRYGKIMIMTDQDQDGSHIKGLLINFIHHNWPSLLRCNFVEEFITPIVKVFRGKEELSFYSLPEYEEWKAATVDWNKWKVKYYKGLGTSSNKEAKEYFSNMKRHQIQFVYGGNEDDGAIDLAFSKKKADDRKEWLTSWMEQRKTRRQYNLPEIYLYEKHTKSITYKDFINKELVLFSNMDNERSIPNLVDGLKPGQRKVMFTCFRRNDKREVKVAQLAGSVAEMSAYHHGEVSLMSTIIGLAQNFVGSNNINLLLPNGQFGTRLQGGKDAASPRYIYTMLNPVTRTMFHPADDPCLTYTWDDNKRTEPEYYCPIVPTVLINGAEGIGTGWSTKIPMYNPRDVARNIQRLISDEDILPMKPWYKNHRGTIERLGPQRYIDSGEIGVIDDQTIEITELPHDIATQSYKEQVLEPMLNGSEKQAPMIQDYKEYHTDSTVRFVVKMAADKLAKFEQEGLHKVFKLQSTITLTSMVLFDADNCLRKFENVEDILREFYAARLRLYEQRQRYMEGLLEAESKRLSNQARFILEKIDGTLILEKRKKQQIVEQLISRDYDPDPVTKWKEEQKRKEKNSAIGESDEAHDEAEDEQNDDGDIFADATEAKDDARLKGYGYLVTMQLIKLSEEEVAKLLRERDAKLAELETLRSKTPKVLWKEDLELFLTALEKQEAKEREDQSANLLQSSGAGKRSKVDVERKRKTPVSHKLETMPNPKSCRVAPVVDLATKEKYEKADKLKENKTAISKEKRLNEAKMDEDDYLTNTPLLERIKKRLIASGDGNKSLDDTTTQPVDEPKSDAMQGTAKKPRTQKPKRTRISSDESESDFEPMDSDDSDPSFEPPTPKKSKSSTAKKFKIEDPDSSFESDLRKTDFKTSTPKKSKAEDTFDSGFGD